MTNTTASASELISYTVRVFKLDKRCRCHGGKKRFADHVYENKNLAMMQDEVASLIAKQYPANKFTIELHETWVTRRNLLTGKEFKERFDTPYHCSPASETYHSM